MITIKKLCKKFGNETILKDFNLTIEKGKLVTILGQSGQGKTTLLRLIAGLETPNSGEIILHQQTCFNETTNLPPQQRNIGFIFQNYALFNHLSVKDNITFGVKEKNKKAPLLKELSATFQIENILNKYPYQLSGGQQQRVAIARSLASEKDILLLDEPFSNLDEELKSSIATFLKKIFKEKNITAILVTHSKVVADQFSDTIINI